ncbi:MAG TPA: flavodoxin domain-containing protein, partial [Cyclobacteriaceae bacterium]|nr:flavodoxin domain-containing protein [Cyclobacteriaceae bacterium]
MLAEPKLKTLLGLIEQSTREELVWINGYLAGLVNHSSESAETVKPQVNKITIVYGTDTGNSKKLASDFALKAKRSGVKTKLQSLDQYRFSDLQKEEYFLVVVSTHGDGEPPAAAKKFYDFIHNNTLSLSQLHYGVLALGDTSYPLFCKTGEDIDLRLEQLGANRVLSLRKCDTDYESDANAWFEHALSSLGSTQSEAPSRSEAKRKSSGKKIYSGSVISNTNLNGRRSAKQTHHIEIEAEDLDYAPGDSIGIVPHNPSQVVEALFEHLQINKSKRIVYREEEYSIDTLFSKKLNIVYL